MFERWQEKFCQSEMFGDQDESYAKVNSVRTFSLPTTPPAANRRNEDLPMSPMRDGRGCGPEVDLLRHGLCRGVGLHGYWVAHREGVTRAADFGDDR